MSYNNIYQIFSEAKDKFPNNIALVEKNKKVTYQELETLIELKSNELINKGITKGDCILVFIPMSIELYVFLLGLFKVGATAVFVDQWSNIGRLNQCLTVVKCKGFAANFKGNLLLKVLSKEVRKIPITIKGKVTQTTFEEKLITIKTTNEDVALITFTTGSTGIPKAAKRTHGFLSAQYRVLKEEINTKPSDIDLVGLPIIILCNLGIGATSVIPDYNLAKLEKLKPEKIVNQINELKVNRIIHSPFFLRKMSSFIKGNSFFTKSINMLLTGGAPVYPNDIRLFNEGFKNAGVNVLYGSTESEPISCIKGSYLINKEKVILEKGLCVGNISEHIKLKIIPITKEHLTFIDEVSFEEFSLVNDRIGEIVVNGEHVLKEYINNPEAIKENKIRVGQEIWHRTGDAGLIFEEELYLVGRADFVFWKNEKLISPFIFEYLLVSEPGIVNGTVLLNKDKVIAYVQPHSLKNKDKLKERLLFKYPIINQVIFLSKIEVDPRHKSKIDYQKLNK